MQHLTVYSRQLTTRTRCISLICTDAVILEGPRNHTAPIETIVTFHCLAEGERAIWQINNTAIFHQEDITDFNGFTPIVTSNGDSSTFNLTMTVNALPENNNTRIICVVYARDYFSSSPGSLTVIGMLSKFDEDSCLFTDQPVVSSMVLNRISTWIP